MGHDETEDEACRIRDSAPNIISNVEDFINRYPGAPEPRAGASVGIPAWLAATQIPHLSPAAPASLL